MYVSDSPSGCMLSVRVTPRAGRSAIAGVRGDQLLVRLAAAPVDGAANEALVEVLAEALGVPRRDVAVVSGERGRSKRVLVRGRDAPAVAAALAPYLAQQ